MIQASAPPRLVSACTAGLLLVGVTGTAHAWTQASLSLLKGWDYALGDQQRSIATYEVANGWEYGDNYFFFDYTNLEGDRDGKTLPNIYGEYAPRLSLGKITGSDLGAGPVSDVLIAGQLEMGENINRRLYGLGFDLDVPGMDYFQLNTYVRDDTDLPGNTWQVTLVWGSHFDLASTKWLFKGHFDYAGSEGHVGHNINSAPQLLLDVGDFWGASDRLYAGVEYQYWKNKYGIEGADEHNPQAMVTWKF
ncbi:outer membrane protein OmpK [Modicisalibacter sp. 'Wilcox']|uniref:outer membrane protein OmpK n=1 Tax=Modicisalibacter sp. 'Wilcox' TaxID=2679914 RepID=UPI0013D4E544|nr:outer membrane protein OmpK [Modicisalibacter sp. 'Wilcox']